MNLSRVTSLLFGWSLMTGLIAAGPILWDFSGVTFDD